MKQHIITQGHVDWFSLRVGKVTASEMCNLLTPELTLRKGQTPLTYAYTKVAEAYRGKPQIHTGSWATEQGQVRQEFAIPFLALEKDWKIQDGGFFETDDGRAGCSPDGIVGNVELFPHEAFGIEVKCPEPTAHVRYLCEGILPKDYVPQVYASLYVTGFKKWVFMSFHNDFPPLILEIYPNEKATSAIASAIDSFHAEFDRAMERIQNITKLREAA